MGFDPNQPRDEKGEWTAGGGGSGKMETHGGGGHVHESKMKGDWKKGNDSGEQTVLKSFSSRSKAMEVAKDSGLDPAGVRRGKFGFEHPGLRAPVASQAQVEHMKQSNSRGLSSVAPFKK
ncbi:MAG TPA: hypothetical protein PLB01_00300 [Thermoanaerobaculia bacterium]|nr:hypothetical protein [Thermoanaerobaculia bacterium]